MKLQKIRQTIKTTLLILFFAGLYLSMSGQTEGTKSTIDYSIRSNFLDPDTLIKGTNEYEIFWHFVEWTHKATEDIEILVLVAEFEKVGITTKDKEFDTAYSFFENVIVFHKRSVENLESFKDLAPGYKKTK